MSVTRIYVIAAESGDEYLVEAATPTKALRHVRRHVAAGMFRIAAASAKDVARLMGDGVKVEAAKADETEAHK